MALPTPKKLSTPRSEQQGTWKPQFTDEQRANFERIAAIDRRANNMATARELVQMFYWRDPRDRKQWFLETLERLARKHGTAYAQTIRSYMSEVRINEYENLNQEQQAGGGADAVAVGKDEGGAG